MEKKEIVKLQAEDKDEQEEEYVYALHSRIYNWFAPAGIDNTFYSVSGAWKCFRQRCISSGLLLEQIAASPRIYSIPNFLSAEELREMHKYIDWANTTGAFKPSRVAHEALNLVDCKQRLSKSVHIDDRYSYLHSLYVKICDLTGAFTSQIEGLQLVQYEKGDHFPAHHDSGTIIDMEKKFVELDEDRLHRIRVCTVLVYLNDMSEDFKNGGETHFPFADRSLTIYPKAGTAIFWSNVKMPDLTTHTKCDFNTDKNSTRILLSTLEADPKTIHAGLPVLGSDVKKYAINIWVTVKAQPKSNFQ